MHLSEGKLLSSLCANHDTSLLRAQSAVPKVGYSSRRDTQLKKPKSCSSFLKNLSSAPKCKLKGFLLHFQESAGFSCKTRRMEVQGNCSVLRLSLRDSYGLDTYLNVWGFFKALTSACHRGPQMSPDFPFSVNIPPPVTLGGWHSTANLVRRGGRAGRIYYHGV